MKLLNEFTIDGKKYCTVRTKGGVSVVEKWEYNNAVNRYMKNGGRMKWTWLKLLWRKRNGKNIIKNG